jgi:hypothetical protein
MKLRMTFFEFCYSSFLGILLGILLLTVFSMLTASANGAEPEPRQRVRVTVRTDTTINSGYGVYLGRGAVAVEKNVTQGSRDMRARVTFATGNSYLGTIVSANFIKLDNLPDFAGRYHLRKRTNRFFRLVSNTTEGEYTPEQLEVIANLPPGTPTQRALIYAIRIHPDAPASTNGTFDPMLAKEAESHSLHQARIQRQGHHNWDARFRRINAVLPAGLVACEVCAESWPGESLVEAAIECVRSWRTSSGHWRAVRTACPVYGYDMKRGSNGVWYATGIFGQK